MPLGSPHQSSGDTDRRSQCQAALRWNFQSPCFWSPRISVHRCLGHVRVGQLWPDVKEGKGWNGAKIGQLGTFVGSLWREMGGAILFFQVSTSSSVGRSRNQDVSDEANWTKSDSHLYDLPACVVDASAWLSFADHIWVPRGSEGNLAKVSLNPICTPSLMAMGGNRTDHPYVLHGVVATSFAQ